MQDSGCHGNQNKKTLKILSETAFGLEFYGLVNTVKVMSSQSVFLTTFPGQV